METAERREIGARRYQMRRKKTAALRRRETDMSSIDKCFELDTRWEAGGSKDRPGGCAFLLWRLQLGSWYARCYWD